jgi:hypothetical protein
MKEAAACSGLAAKGCCLTTEGFRRATTFSYSTAEGCQSAANICCLTRESSVKPQPFVVWQKKVVVKQRKVAS